MTNEQIDIAVCTIVRAYVEGTKVREEDEPVIKAGVDLIVNLLQNINDIARKSVRVS